MKVADVMARHVEFVSVDTKVKDVVTLIFGRGINGLPVCKDRKVVGFITERDILARFYPSMQEYVEDPFRSADFENMEKKVDEIFEMTADKIMSKNATTVTEDTPLLRAQSLMFIEKVGRLPVVDNKSRLIGIISKGDIFKAVVGDKIFFTEDKDYNDWISKTYYRAVDMKDRLEHEMPDLLKIFSQNHVAKILDIGCGTGDHAIELAKKGFTVIGTDRSLGMIKEANRRKQVLSEETKARVKFLNGETEPILTKLNINFDAVLFMGNTISHNPYNIKDLIKNISGYLTQRGVMILQITNFEKMIKVRKRLKSFNFAKLEDGIEHEYAFLEFYDPPNMQEKTILKTFAILRSDVKRWKWLGVRNSVMAYIDEEIMTNILKKNDFKKISFYGGFFDGIKWDYLFRKPFKPLESDWLNVVAVR